MNGHAVTMVVDEGAANVQRVATVLAHQRALLRSMVVERQCHGGFLVRLVVDGTEATLEQLVRRLARTVCVRQIDVDPRRPAAPAHLDGAVSSHQR